MTVYFKMAYGAVSALLMALSCVDLSAAADVDSLLFRADSLRKAYQFSKSIDLYDKALALETDSVARIGIEDAKMLSENGLGMTDFVLQPTVVARHRFSLEDFYLYYPLEDAGWRSLPNVLDSIGGHPFYKAVYVPGEVSSLYYSSHDQDGTVNIYRTDRKDTTWCVPYLLNEYLVSSGDEIYPMLSPDGKRLYFASSGLYGMGGFDLYVSTWNEDQQEWGPPANMGMPYSSPYNDFLFIDTADGKYSVFASDRDCAGTDSVDVYVVEHESMPVRKSMDNVWQLRSTMSLTPVDDMTKFDSSTVVSQEITPQNDETRRYTDKVSEVMALRDSIQACNARISERRDLLAASSDDSERAALTDEIMAAEALIPQLQDSLGRASEILQQIEMDFLFKGIVLDPDKLMVEADREVEGVSSNYVFARMSPGAPLDMVLEKPQVKFDYTFMILPEGRFAEDNDIPDGVVYQIQIFSLSSKASVASIKGLSPVFEEASASGRYIYRVGVFRKYNDVLANLNRVKKLGFRTAFITAFYDGEPVTVNKARALEKEAAVVSLYQINVFPEGDNLPDLALKAIRQLCGNVDVAKADRDGKTVYLVGPVDDKALVDKVVVAIKATGVDEVFPVVIGTRKE